MKTSALRLLLVFASACGPAGPGPEASALGGATSDPIFYGSTSPTLYTTLSTQQQNAVVSVCFFGDAGCFCSGTMISPHVVLTAAHCLDQRPDYHVLTAGEVEVHVGPNNDSPVAHLPVRAVDYVDKSNEATDVGVVILTNTSSSVTPIPFKSGGVSAIDNHNAQAVGFGMTETSTEYNPNTVRHWTTIYATDVSWGVISVDGGGDSGVAPGDSGGPLLYNFGSGVRVAGVASTSVTSYVDEAYYFAVSSETAGDAEEAFIQSYVDAYDNPACTTACNGVQCGQSGGCECGGCSRGYECLSNLCQLVQPGTGGVCLTLESTRTECGDNDDCYGEEICYPYGNGDSECGEACGPEPCKPGDRYSVCLGGGGYVKICYESGSHTSCDGTEPFCTTADGRSGYCFCAGGARTCATGECYGRCDTVVTCPDGTGCIPYAQSCADVCRPGDCDVISGCDCGDCATGNTCVDNVCVCAPDCAGRQCGDDLCGGFCGLCTYPYVCSTGGLCVLSEDEPTSCTNCNAAAAGGWAVAAALALIVRRRRR